MALTIFYAWQSDTHAKANHYLIRDALEDAIDALNADAVVEEAIRLDHDTKGKTGTPHVADTILEKIRNCDIFVADLTCGGRTLGKIVKGKRRRKRLPNPNVMLETGYASALISWDQIVLVMNTAFGGPKHLPFDLKYRRFPIQYDLPSDQGQPLDPTRAKKAKADLVGTFKTAIGEIIVARSFYQRGDLAKRKEELRERIAAERSAFEMMILQRQDFDVTGGVCVLSIHTFVPTAEPLELVRIGKAELLNMFLPSEAPEGRVEWFKDAISARFPSAMDTKAEMLTKLTDRGTLFAAQNWIGQPPDGETIKKWNVYDKWRFFIDDVYRYLRAFRDLKIPKPWTIVISLRICQNSLATLPASDWATAALNPGRASKNNEAITFESIEVPVEIDLTTKKSIENLLHHVYRGIWMWYGHPGAPAFDHAGRFTGFEMT